MVFDVFKRFAQREIEVEAVFVADVAGQCRLHRGNVADCELDGFQVGEAPPDFAEARRNVERAAISGNAVRLSSDRLEHVAI